VAVTRSSGIRFTTRAATGGPTDSTPATGAAPVWVRLVRSGSKFTAYKSTDGNHWTQIGTRTISMTGSVLIGLAVTAHNAAALNASAFDHVRITGAASTTRAVTVSGSASTSPATASAPGARAAGAVPWA
jgi:hypothetical protein